MGDPVLSVNKGYCLLNERGFCLLNAQAKYNSDNGGGLLPEATTPVRSGNRISHEIKHVKDHSKRHKMGKDSSSGDESWKERMSLLKGWNIRTLCPTVTERDG
ncbi:hypothetical protein Tco_0421951 [Tanacetum coccineum]